ncbi:hypothetical protein C0J52_01874 [Blattella germanica]|nr:hypothetical protein C0J52_01874 [Blattella germanica]
MSLNRIQKLLFSEYSDFEDVVLVESPFAETTREGKGIQQIQIGLTPTKLILAAEVIQSANKADVLFHSKLDLYVKNFEFISVFPIQCVNLSVFHRRARHTLKAHFCNNQIRYFELGGIENSEVSQIKSFIRLLDKYNLLSMLNNHTVKLE